MKNPLDRKTIVERTEFSLIDLFDEEFLGVAIDKLNQIKDKYGEKLMHLEYCGYDNGYDAIYFETTREETDEEYEKRMARREYNRLRREKKKNG